MDYLRFRIHYSGEPSHPMHEFEMRHDDLHGSELLHWNASIGETNALVFRVRGEPAAYRAKLDRRAETLAYSVTSATDGVFYCCVRERLTDNDRTFVGAFAQGTLVVIPPISYNQDGTTDATVVGTPSDIDAMIDRLPDAIDIEVLSVGEYRTRAGPASERLTDRQREAVEVALACGYYDSPRRGTTSEVASELNVAPSTAAEHLRKAEASVMEYVLQRA